jgi:uncharacterized protein (DUF697 family)
VSKGFLLALLGSVVTGAGATIAGRTIVAGLLKMVPGAGSAAGATVSAMTASAVTTAFGEAYIATLAVLFDAARGEPPTDQEIIERFRQEISTKKLKNEE